MELNVLLFQGFQSGIRRQNLSMPHLSENVSICQTPGSAGDSLPGGPSACSCPSCVPRHQRGGGGGRSACAWQQVRAPAQVTPMALSPPGDAKAARCCGRKRKHVLHADNPSSFQKLWHRHVSVYPILCSRLLPLRPGTAPLEMQFFHFTCLPPFIQCGYA